MQLLLLFSLLISCEDEREPFPYVYVDVTFNVSTQLNDLVVGEFQFIEGKGYGGLIIYRSGRNSFQAFDRACTYKPKRKCILERDDEFEGLVECPCCGSSYLISEEGMVFNGPSVVPLKQYDAYYNRASNELHVRSN